MIKREHVEKLKEIIDGMDTGYDIGVIDVEKLNGEGYTGISVKIPGYRASVAIDPNKVIDDIDECDLSVVAEEIISMAISAMEDDLAYPFEVCDYEKVKSKLTLQAVNYEKNKEMLEKVPHMMMCDIAIVCRIVFDDYDDYGISSIVTNDMLKIYGITRRELFADACEIAEKTRPIRVKSMKEVMLERYGMEIEDSGMYVITCNDGVYGSGCLAYNNFAEKVSSVLGEKFFILPSSVHELLAVGYEYNVKELREIVKNVNDSELEEKDRLSYNVYRFSDGVVWST